jgi:hypothetical protein
MLSLVLTALATQVAADGHLPFTWPDGMPVPLAYYWLDEGSGTKLKESVSGVTDAGFVDHEIADQPNGVYPGETWIVDPNFGNVFQCGNPDTMAKDVLRLADIDYGSTGKFTINFWVRNPVGTDFPDREREQIFGHGDPNEITSAPNVIHIQMENLHLHSSSPGGEILTILADGNDFKSCVKEGVLTANQFAGTATKDADGNVLNPERETVEQLTGMDVFPATTCPVLFADLETEGVCTKNTTTQDWECPDVMGRCIYNETSKEVQGCNRVNRGSSTKSKFWSDDDPPKMLGTIGITNDEWHMVTVTTHPDGSKGHVTYIDGVARSAIPYRAGVGEDPGYANGPVNGGDPIDPVGPFRFCGREKPGDWSGEAGAVFDAERYSNVELAHFSVYEGAMTGAQVEELRQAYFTRFFPPRKEGYYATRGACRGPGGENDKVNSKYKTGMTLDACATECDNNAGQCKGFAYSPTANGGECLIYGPAFSGSCSDASATSPTACAALGTCSDAAKTSEDTCGACSLPSGTSEATCDQIGGTWTPATWTSSGATWNEPTGDWISDYHPSDLVVGVVESGDYTCYDVDNQDHHPKCEGSLGTVDDTSYRCTEQDVSDGVQGCSGTGDYKCAESTCGSSNCGGDCGQGEGTAYTFACAAGCAYCTEVCWPAESPCHQTFLGLAKAQKTASMCPEGCVYTAEVQAVKVSAVHSKVVQRGGWEHMAGVCRSEGDAMSVEAKPNGRYSKTAGENGAPATQEECMDHCEAEPDCIGYAHADNSWCLNYGPNLHDVGESTIWTGDNHVATTITQTKPNPAYICGVKVPTSAPTPAPTLDPTPAPTPTPTTATPTTKADQADVEQTQSMSWRGAMLTLSFWLTSFLQ